MILETSQICIHFMHVFLYKTKLNWSNNYRNCSSYRYKQISSINLSKKKFQKWKAYYFVWKVFLKSMLHECNLQTYCKYLINKLLWICMFRPRVIRTNYDTTINICHSIYRLLLLVMEQMVRNILASLHSNNR